MLDGRTDLAVHSAKDMPTEVPEGLAIVAFTAREDVRDVFVAGAAVAAAHARRPAARRDRRHLQPAAPLAAARAAPGPRSRGHPRQRADAPAQARRAGHGRHDPGGRRPGAAGPARAGVAFAFAFDEMLPAVGQGSLAIEARAGDERVAALVAPLIDERTRAGRACRAGLMRALQGGCQVPIAGLAELDGGDGPGDAGRESLRLRAFVGSLDGRRSRARRALGRGRRRRRPRRWRSPRDLLADGADAILAEVRGDA